MSIPVSSQQRCSELLVTRPPLLSRMGLMMICCSALAGQPALAETKSTGSGQSASSVPEVNLWVRGAELSLVVEQLAQMSGRTAAIEGKLDVPVSGRLTGNIEQALANLSANYPVQFDFDDSELRATGNDSGSHVSVVADSLGQSGGFKEDVSEQLLPESDIEKMGESLGESAVRDLAEVQPEPEIEAAVLDAGSNELMADIMDEGKPPADQATLSEPARWVTDIPGFDTF